MTKYGDEFPGVNVDTGTPENTAIGSTHEYIHLDDTDEIDEFGRYTVYVYNDEERYEELAETISEFRENYIFATGVTFPSWIRDEMPLEADVLNAVVWRVMIGEQLTPELLEEYQSKES